MSLIARRAVRLAGVARAIPVAGRRLASTTPAPAAAEKPYPVVPDVSRQYLPPLGWDDPLLRRNIGDPVHEYDELYSMWGPDIPVIAPHIALRRFTYAVIAFVSFGFTVKYALTPEMPAVRRQYPFSGLVTELGGLDENKAIMEEESDE